MLFPPKFLNFVDVCCDGSFELPLAKACKIAGLNAQSIKNDRTDARRRPPLLQSFRRGGRLYVSSIEIFRHLQENPAFSAFLAEAENSASPAKHTLTRRRGAPTLEEKKAASVRGLTVSELRRAQQASEVQK